jgi:(p)ppGpp synthase/HD superfamily hydrolase
MLTGKQLIIAASKFAANAHRGQFRVDGKTPYMAHVVDVAERYAKMFPDDHYGYAVALLHDVLEDTAVIVEELNDAGFGQLVPDLMLLNRGDVGERGSYLEYLLKIKQSSRVTITTAHYVKLADVESNLEDTKNIRSSHIRESLTNKYEMARYILNS